MVDKLIDAANYFKNKWSKDQMRQLLTSAINDEQFQPATTILHQIANASYSIDQWSKIWIFILDKLKSSKGVRVNKALTLIEFLLKNGNEAIVADLKEEIRMFRDLEEFKGKGETQLRISSIHRKANIIVELLNNPRRLHQERAEAEAIKAKLGGNNYSNKTYNNNAKSITNNKVTYEGIGSNTYNPPKQQPHSFKFQTFNKPVSNRLEHKQSNEQKKPKPTGKLFDGLNVKKPMGVTKIHGEHAPKQVKKQIKHQSGIVTNVAQPNVDFFNLDTTPKEIKKTSSSNIDLFEISPVERSQSEPQHKQPSAVSSNTFDIFGLSSNASGLQTAQFNSNITNAKSDTFSFGPQHNSNIYVLNNPSYQTKPPQQSSFDIFENQFNKPIEIKTEIKMNPVVYDNKVNEAPKSKYDMFQQFMF